jgi:hypothetical protein
MNIDLIDPSKLKLTPANAGEQNQPNNGHIRRIPDGLRKAFGLESEAASLLRSAKQEREREEKKLSAWNGMVNDLCSRQERLKNALAQMASLRDGIAKGREIVFDHLGSPEAAHAEAAIKCAIQAVETEGALPLLEAAAEKIGEDLRAHIRAARDFGKQNALPSDVLASLPKI